MVRREMQREASILRPGRMAPAGHASMQRWQFPQPSGTAGRPASSSAVVTISPGSNERLGQGIHPTGEIVIRQLFSAVQ